MGGLVVTNCPQYTRCDDFRRRLRRELDVPFARAGPLDGRALAEPALLDLQDTVGRGRVGCQSVTSDAPEQVAVRLRRVPELRKRIRGRRDGCRSRDRPAAGYGGEQHEQQDDRGPASGDGRIESSNSSER